jgi:hypothetical protein
MPNDGNQGTENNGASQDDKKTTTSAAPPWGSAEEFNPERAWTLIQNLRAEKDEHKAKADEFGTKVKEFEDKDKTELERATGKLSEVEKRAADAEHAALRLEVALDKAPEGMSVAQVKKLAKRLAGKNKAELEADAAELFADFAPTKDDAPKGGGSGRPRERLRPGASSDDEPDEMDPAKLAAKVQRRW